MTVEQVKDKVLELIHDKTDDGSVEIYTDYHDRELGKDTIREILEAKNPKEKFTELLCEYADDYAYSCGYDRVISEIRADLSEDEVKIFNDNFDEFVDLIRENISFYYDEYDFNNMLNVNIMIDCGNGNYDFSCDNVLNYYGDGNIDNESSILWLAKTQGKATALRKACKRQYKDDGYYVDRNKETDKFIESCIQELENLSSSMGTMTFLVKISLFELFDLFEIQNNEYDEKGKYDPRLNEKSKSYIVLSKDTECGLYDSWNGGGSCLEIELDKDIKIPIKYCIFCVEGCKMHGYDVNEVYGLVDSCWKRTLLEIEEVI